MKRVVKKVLKLSGKTAKHAAKFSLNLLANALEASAKTKKHKPTLTELTCEEKSVLSDKYFVNK